MKLAIFDFDSTLMQGETLEIIARECNIHGIEEITTNAMEGKMDFFESLVNRVSLLKGIPENKVKEICENLPYTKGAKEVIAELKRRGYKVICLSGGFDLAVLPSKKILGFDTYFSNILHIKDGMLTGMVGGELMFSESKGNILKRLQDIMEIGIQDTLVVGDGANDLSMFKYAKDRVAFCAKPILKEHASIVVEKKDLTEILNYL